MRPLLSLMAVSLLLACNTGTSPSGLVTGNWAAFGQPVAGSSHTMTITQLGGAVSGTGTYSREAGPSGTFAVTGEAAFPSVTLHFAYDYGPVSQFEGLIADGHLTGRESFATGYGDSLTFTRR